MSDTYNWHDIERKAMNFSVNWATEDDERGEAKTFWDEFFQIFNVRRHSFAKFEGRVKRAGNRQGFIDVFWEGKFLVEHKSAYKNKDKDFDTAFEQAIGYFDGLATEKRPQFIAICSFQRFRLHDLERNTIHDFPLDELAANIRLFKFLPDFVNELIEREEKANIDAAERMGLLHDAIEKDGFQGQDLELLLVRLLFCLFAEDTGIFAGEGRFKSWLLGFYPDRVHELGSGILQLFDALNTPLAQRSPDLSGFKLFPFVNGGLFEKPIARLPSFTLQTMLALKKCCEFDWSGISPAIFGSLFQSVMNADERRSLGAHYTSEKNIARLIEPLFMDALRAEFRAARANLKRLQAFHEKIGRLRFLDPACGCGNFLVVTYKDLRLLELEVVRALLNDFGGNIDAKLLKVNSLRRVRLTNFFGCEIEESSFLIAQTALWLADHQCNQLLEAAFGEYIPSVPLPRGAAIRLANALRIDWAEEFPGVDFIIGNPPFSGSKIMSDTQREEIKTLFQNEPGSGTLDYVTGWYLKAAQYLDRWPETLSAFVSTNSISQGEQVGMLWGTLFRHGLKIRFAHQTFKWMNEAPGMAAVYCIIVGFGKQKPPTCRLFEYPDIRGEGLESAVKNINPYLVEAGDVVVRSRQKPLCDVPEIKFGNQPIDGGFLLFSDDEKEEFVKNEPGAKKIIRQFVGSDEYINGKSRWCLWLENFENSEFENYPLLMERLDLVKKFRLESKRPDTNKLAATPWKFAFVSHQESEYVIIPSVSSEKRHYVPIGFMPKNVIASNLCLIVAKADIFLFGILTSEMHMAWMRYVCGRLKSDYRYSNSIVYNNFPFPTAAPPEAKKAVEAAASAVLAERAKYLTPSPSPKGEGTKIGKTLAFLYDPDKMPAGLLAAHQTLDKKVDECYGLKGGFGSEAKRVAWLFERYGELVRAGAKP